MYLPFVTTTSILSSFHHPWMTSSFWPRNWPTLLDANEVHVFSAPPDMQLSISRVRLLGPLAWDMHSIHAQHSPDSQHPTGSMELSVSLVI